MHSHSESSPHSHSHAAVTGNKKVLWWVLGLSGSYLMAEVVGGIMSGSLALLADAGHMALDVAATALGLFAFWISHRPPTAQRTYGYYRAEILAALLNAVTLFLVSGWIFYEAFQRFSSPPEVHGGLMAIVAAGGLLINFASLYVMSRQRDENLNMKGVWLHIVTDTLGSVAALAAAFAVWKFNWNLADPIISIVIALLILYGAGKLLVECVDVLLVSAPKGIDTGQLQKDIEMVKGVKELHDLHIWSMNTGLNAISVHIRLTANETDSAELLKAVNELLRDKYQIAHSTLQLEPPSFYHSGAHYCAPGHAFHVHDPKTKGPDLHQ